MTTSSVIGCLSDLLHDLLLGETPGAICAANVWKRRSGKGPGLANHESDLGRRLRTHPNQASDDTAAPADTLTTTSSEILSPSSQGKPCSDY